MKTEKMDINAVCFGILCNFTPVCGEERAKEAVALIRSLQAQLEQAKAERDEAIKDLRHSDMAFLAKPYFSPAKKPKRR